MVEGVRYDVLVHVVAQVAVESGADVLVDGFKLDEDERQPVDEADKIGTAVVVGRAQPGELQFAHGQEAIGARLVVEVDHLRTGVVQAAGSVAIVNGHAIAD